MDIYNLVSFLGLFVLIGFAWLLSAERRRVNLRTVAAGLLLQLVFAGLLFWTPGSRGLFLWLNDMVVAVLEAAKDGQKFVFGALAVEGEQSVGFILACQALPLAIVFAALMALLYHWGIMQRIIRGFAWVFTRAMRTSGAESLVAASNIFVGVESATTVRPYLTRMTASELCTVLTAGMATIASTVMAFYVSILRDSFPTIAGHLISASIISAPAAIVMSKLLVPETGEPVTLGRTVAIEHQRESGAIAAVINGATAGLQLVFGIVALLIALLGLLAIADLLLGAIGHGTAGGANWLGERIGAEWHLSFGWSLKGLLGYVMYPFALVMGVPPEDAGKVGQLLGTRLVATEIPAYMDLAATMKANGLHHPRTAVVTAYALCGFAHVASLAIFIGGIAALAPERKNDLARVGGRALLAATLACLMTGAVAGTFFHDGLTVLDAPATEETAATLQAGETEGIDALVCQVQTTEAPQRRIDVNCETDSESFLLVWGTAAEPARASLRIGLSAQAVDYAFYFADARLILASVTVARYPLGDDGFIYDQSRLTEIGKETFYFRDCAPVGRKSAGDTTELQCDAPELQELAAFLLQHWGDKEVDLDSWIKDGRLAAP